MAAAPGSRASAPSVRPNASWVELSAGYGSSSSRGMGGTARAGGDLKSGGGRRVGLAAGTGEERLPHGRGGHAQQALILGVRHGLEPSLEARAPGPLREGTQSPAPAKLDDPPAARREHRAELAGARVRNDAVERPAGHVDDPEDAPRPLPPLLGERPPGVAPLEAGIPA